MTSPLVVLRTSVLLMLLLATFTGLYVRHVTRLSADAAAQTAAGAAAQAATAAGWQCQTAPPPESVIAAARAAWSQIDHLAVQPVAVEVSADACNLITTVTAAPLDSRVSSLNTTAAACRAAVRTAVLSVPGSC
ncbi:MAG: hypothetical protein F4129_07215 [Acidimicrobiia bacterium]|nr:hypothetical protein [Acidimicrobiia bacterium]MYL09714.1 hypothetical protein [Acidimicrobiia bacterium]